VAAWACLVLYRPSMFVCMLRTSDKPTWILSFVGQACFALVSAHAKQTHLAFREYFQDLVFDFLQLALVLCTAHDLWPVVCVCVCAISSAFVYVCVCVCGVCCVAAIPALRITCSVETGTNGNARTGLVHFSANRRLHQVPISLLTAPATHKLLLRKHAIPYTSCTPIWPLSS